MSIELLQEIESMKNEINNLSNEMIIAKKAIDLSLRADTIHSVAINDLPQITNEEMLGNPSTVFESESGTKRGTLEQLINIVIPAGLALPWHSKLIPDGWVAYDGSDFDPDENPQNFEIFPSGKWPNYAGRVPEGYIDDDNGVIGSEQSGGLIQHDHDLTVTCSFVGDALPTHAHKVLSEASASDGDGAIGDSYDSDTTTSYSVATNAVSAGTPSGAVTAEAVASSTGGERNTVDRVICYWIGRKG